MEAALSIAAQTHLLSVGSQGRTPTAGGLTAQDSPPTRGDHYRRARQQLSPDRHRPVDQPKAAARHLTLGVLVCEAGTTGPRGCRRPVKGWHRG